MARYALRRLGYLLVQVLLVATVAFLLIHLVPGNPVRAMLGQDAPEGQVRQVEHALGLDRPILVQYGIWLGQVARGDFGTSVTAGWAVLPEVMTRLGNTLELIVGAIVLSVLVGVPLGAAAARRPNSATDLVLGWVAMAGISLPSFVTGSLLLLLFAVQWHLLPHLEFVPWRRNPVQHLELLVLPCVTLAAGSGAVVMRMARSSLLEVTREDYMRTARAKGLSEAMALRRHALKNAMNPVVSVLGLQVGSLLGGTVIVETIYGWPGLSTLLLDAISQRDYPVIQGIVLAIAILTVLVNLAVDLVYAYLDPRIRYA
jgi:peptide/nickel transport system permease protein